MKVQNRDIGSLWLGLLLAACFGATANGADLHLRFDGSAAPASLYQKDVCKAVEGGLDTHPCIKYVPGRFGQALVFERYAVAAVPFRFDPHVTPQMSVTAWVKKPAGGIGFGYLLSTGGADGTPHFGLHSGQPSIYGGRSTIDEGKNPDLFPKMPFDEWVFVAGVWDYETRTMRLHQNGEHVEFTDLKMDLDPQARQVRERVKTFAPPGTNAAGHFIFIGADNFLAMGAGLKGVAIDDVRLFKRALSVFEIEDLRSRGEDAQVAALDLAPAASPVAEAPAEVVKVPDVIVPGSEPKLPTVIRGGQEKPEESKPEVVQPSPEAPETSEEEPLEEEVETVLAAEEDSVPAEVEVTEPPTEVLSPPPVIETSEDEAEADISPPVLEPAPVTTPTKPVPKPVIKRPVPSGPTRSSSVAGAEGNIRATIELNTQFLEGVSWTEHQGRPCSAVGLGAEGSPLSGKAFGCPPSMSLSLKSPASEADHRVRLASAKVGRIQVCHDQSSSQFIKGVRVWGWTVNPDASLTYVPEGEEEVLPNCKVWSPSVLCPVGLIGTGLVVHGKDLLGDGQAEIVGLQLLCREVGLQ